MLFSFNVQLRNKYDDNDIDCVCNAPPGCPLWGFHPCLWPLKAPGFTVGKGRQACHLPTDATYLWFSEEESRNTNYKLHFHVHSSCAPVSEMTYTVSSGTLNSSIPYHTIKLRIVRNLLNWHLRYKIQILEESFWFQCQSLSLKTRLTAVDNLGR